MPNNYEQTFLQFLCSHDFTESNCAIVSCDSKNLVFGPPSLFLCTAMTVLVVEINRSTCTAHLLPYVRIFMSARGGRNYYLQSVPSGYYLIFFPEEFRPSHYLVW